MTKEAFETEMETETEREAVEVSEEEQREQTRVPEEGPEIRPVSQWRLVRMRFFRHRLGVFSGILLLALTLIMVFGEFIGPYSFNKNHLRFSNAPPTRIHIFNEGGLRWPYVCATKLKLGGGYESDCGATYPVRFFIKGEPYTLLGFIEWDVHLFGTGESSFSPGQFFLFGTDWAGRDIFTRTLVGGRTTLLLSVVVVLLALIVGVPIGGLSGYRGGLTDGFIQKAIELIMGVPRLALLLALSLILEVRNVSPEVRLGGIAFILVFVSWAPIARVIRGQFLALREVDFVTAAQSIGSSDMRIILKHILPNVMSYLIVTATLTVPTVIIVESTLSFLGYGVREPLVSWGSLLNVAIQQMTLVLTQYPWNLIPGLFIIVAVLLFNFVGDALRDALDPFTVVSETE